MAKKWRNNSGILELQGFADFYAKIEEMGKNAEIEGRKLFEKSAEIMYDELYNKASAANLDPRLLEKIDEKFIEMPSANIWRYEVGWKKPHPKNPLPDTYKVMFYNYGTPSGDRITKEGENRGQEPAHPLGSHGFIKKAKIAAAKKTKKLQEQTLEKIIGSR